MPLFPAGNNEAADISEIEVAPPGYLFIHTSRPSAQCLKIDAYAKDRKRDKDLYPHLLTDAGTSTG